MKILGLDYLLFGVDDVAACEQFLLDYGLQPKGGGRFEALDGSGVVVKNRSDASLPPPLPTGNTLRKAVYGVADHATLQAIETELRRDREVKKLADGSIEATDDVGFVVGFEISVRKPLALMSERVNAPGDVQRGPNLLGVPGVDPIVHPSPRTLSHVVYFVPDPDKAEPFYTQRLGFRVTDRFIGMGPFLRPQGTLDHHTMFFIKTPPHLQGCEHFTFHMGGPTEVFTAGYAMAKKGHKSFWGPGRHRFGSNWFWYFRSPFGCVIEFDADMDLHDDSWVPRTAPAQADKSQIFLFHWQDTWAPGGAPPPAINVTG
jgi:catechol 2,3-dioxygenase-like lactoylglutathione lyase family enzyme